MHNLTKDPAGNNVLLSEPMIHVDTFQPFDSRIGTDVVMRLKFEYDPALVCQLKRILAPYKANAVNRTLGRLTPGGWLPEHRCWFLEASIWEAVKLELQYSGYRVWEANP